MAVNPAGPAQAQTPTTVKLVGNTGQEDGAVQGFQHDHAQAFNTGLHASGYTLTRLDLKLKLNTGAQPTYSSERPRGLLWQSGRKPGHAH